jgi:hypothetical protein
VKGDAYTPRLRRRSASLGKRAAAVVGVAAAVGIAGPACSSRDLTVEVTTEGATTLVAACESYQGVCGPETCHENLVLCTQDTCELQQACMLGNNPEWSPDVTMGMRLLLLEVSPEALTIKTSSPCVPLNLRPCILDPTEANGCRCIMNPLGTMTCSDPTGEAKLECIRDSLAQAVQSAMGTGLSFAGFTSTDGVALVAALYEKPGSEMICDGEPLVNPSDCTRQQLTAVAGLGAPSGGTTFDVTCASCQGGTHDAVGPDNAPCPATRDACFLQRVAAALATAGL